MSITYSSVAVANGIIGEIRKVPVAKNARMCFKMINLEPIYTELIRTWKSGTMDSVNGKESTMSEWQKLSDSEKRFQLLSLAAENNIQLQPSAEEIINKEELFVQTLLEHSELVTTLQDECNLCGKKLMVTKVSQFAMADDEDKVTPDSLPRIICTGCEV